MADLIQMLETAVKARRDHPNRVNRYCTAPPIGCGAPIMEFRDKLSEREHQISGLCQECQDRIFGSCDDEEICGGHCE